MVGRMRRSMILMLGHNSETVLKDVEASDGLFGLRRGMMTEVFQMLGMLPDLTELLKMSVRYCMPVGPMCFRCTVEMPSGPRALEALAFLMASVVCWALNCCGEAFRLFFLISFFILRAVLELLWVITDENCLLKAATIFDGLDRYFPLNLIAWFWLDL